MIAQKRPADPIASSAGPGPRYGGLLPPHVSYGAAGHVLNLGDAGIGAGGTDCTDGRVGHGGPGGECGGGDLGRRDAGRGPERGRGGGEAAGQEDVADAGAGRVGRRAQAGGRAGKVTEAPAATVELLSTVSHGQATWGLLEVGPLHTADFLVLTEAVRIWLEDHAAGIRGLGVYRD